MKAAAFQRLRDTVLRGRRMTKWKGIAASIAPMTGTVHAALMMAGAVSVGSAGQAMACTFSGGAMNCNSSNYIFSSQIFIASSTTNIIENESVITRTSGNGVGIRFEYTNNVTFSMSDSRYIFNSGTDDAINSNFTRGTRLSLIGSEISVNVPRNGIEINNSNDAQIYLERSRVSVIPGNTGDAVALWAQPQQTSRGFDNTLVVSDRSELSGNRFGALISIRDGSVRIEGRSSVSGSSGGIALNIAGVDRIDVLDRSIVSGGETFGIGSIGVTQSPRPLIINVDNSTIRGGSSSSFGIAGGSISLLGSVSQPADIRISNGSLLDGRVTLTQNADIMRLENSAVHGDIHLGEGDDRLVILASEVVGGVFGGLGSDQIQIFSGSNLESVNVLDGGVDHSGAVDLDILTFDGWSGALDGDNLINWARVVLDGGADVSFGPTLKVGVDGDDIAETGMGLFVEAGSTLRAAGDFTLTGNLINRGLVTMIDNLVGDVVTVSGNYSSNSTLAFDVDFAIATADTLVINGNVLAGSEADIVVNVVGGAGTGETVRLITVDGDNNGEYTLVGGPIDSGVWTYNLLVGQNVDLVAGIDGINPINPIGAVYESAPSVLLSGFASLPTLEQRVGQRQWLVRGDDGVDGVWMRLHGERARVTPRDSDSGASWRGNSWGLQLGADFLAAESENGYWVLGVTGQYGRISVDVSNALGDGRISGDGWGLGATATWHGYGGTYLDLQGQANRISAAYATSAHGSLASSRRATAYALSAELGHRFTLDEGRQHALVPQAQLSWGQLSGGSFTDRQGNDVNLGTNARTIGRLGLAYEYRPNGLTQGQRANDEQMLYGIVNILHDFSSASSVDVAGTTLRAQGVRTWGEVGIGGSVAVAPNAMLYGEISYRQALGSGASGNNSLNGTLGLRVQW